MLDKVKIALRIRTAVYDTEIKDLIQAARADLRLVGINGKKNGPLIERAIILYCKANFGFIEDSERFQKAYEALKCSLSLVGDYRA